MGVAGLLTFEIGLERALVREQHGGFECLVTLSSHCAFLDALPPTHTELFKRLKINRCPRLSWDGMMTVLRVI